MSVQDALGSKAPVPVGRAQGPLDILQQGESVRRLRAWRDGLYECKCTGLGECVGCGATREVARLKEALLKVSAAFACGKSAQDMHDIVVDAMFTSPEFVELYSRHNMDGVPR